MTDTEPDDSPPETATQHDRLRWVLLLALAVVAVVCLAVAGSLVVARGVGDDPLDRIDSLRQDPGPAPDVEREQLLKLGRDFVVRFNTYGPDMLEGGHLPEYASLEELMSAKFAAAFESNIGYAEQTVADTGTSRSADVYAVGIASQDSDSAELLVAGTVQFSYPNPEKKGDPIRFPPNRVRYQVSLVKVDGEWLVDDLDDVDDGLPSLADANPDQPSEQPTPTTPEQGEGGGQQGREGRR